MTKKMALNCTKKDKRQKYEIWLCDLTHTQQTIASDTVPLACGVIASYCNKVIPAEINFSIYKYPEKLIKNIFKKQPKVIGFSNFFWNIDLSYSIAKKIKELYPEIVVVFGGLNFPTERDKQELFLKKRNKIDFYIYGEGEKSFSELLNRLINNSFNVDKVKQERPGNCCYIYDGEYLAGINLPRIEISEVPSPYLEGRLDEFIADGFMPLIQTCRGCPFACAYCCAAQPYYNKLSFRNPKEVMAELEYIAQRCKKNQKLFIADSNFGQYRQDLKIAQVIAKIQKKYNYPQYIHVATGKNNKENVVAVAKTINGALRLSASVQSTDPEVLKNIKRSNVSIETLINLVKEANQTESNTYSDVILCLPGDSKKAHLKSLETIINTELNYSHPLTLMLLNGSEVATSKMKKEFGLVSKFRVLPRCFGTYKFGKDKINSIEIEEVCVGGNNLSFKDYLDCRKFHLIIGVFYNDGILVELFSFIKQYGITPFDLLNRMNECSDNFSKNLKELFDSFINETVDELWDSAEELEEFAKNEETIKKYIKGEYGSNLIFKHRALAYIKLIKDLHDVAYSSAKELIAARSNEAEVVEIYQFLDSVKKYSVNQKEDVLTPEKSYKECFNYDMRKALSRQFSVKPDLIKLKKPQCIEFKHSRRQAETIKNYIQEFGLSVTGIGRILSRAHIKKMYRKIIYL